jgi:hypothetical protein
MNIDDMTIGQAKELSAMFGNKQQTKDNLNSMIGQKVIVRTYSAGVFYGILKEKSGNEVILNDARRLWYWFATEGISLSSVAIHGLKNTSKVVEAVELIWLEAIEIIPCTKEAIKSIEGQKNVKAS